MPAPEVYTSGTKRDPDIRSEDEDDFQPFALPDFGDDLPLLMASLTRILFPSLFQSMITSSFGHPDGEHTVTPILDVVPPVFDDDIDLFVDGPPDDAHDAGKLDENVVAIPHLEIHAIKLSSDTILHSVSDSFESVTSATLQTTRL
ncbi:hypothetical protein Hanom_Chr01g00044731 [Helianthus anomalus]